jgi:hypothetical protein
MAKLICDMEDHLQAIEQQAIRWHSESDVSNRLETIPGIGAQRRHVVGATLQGQQSDPIASKAGQDRTLASDDCNTTSKPLNITN